jgi:hypothetical protein
VALLIAPIGLKSSVLQICRHFAPPFFILLLETQSALAQTHKTLLADHQVIQHLDIQQPTRLNKLARHRDVLMIYVENQLDITSSKRYGREQTAVQEICR